MQVPLTAYAEDCSFTGDVVLEGDRLSDFLTTAVEFGVMNVTGRALDDGRPVDCLYSEMTRDDLYLVVAGEPRGREELRVWTRQYPIVAKVGPYSVRGYVHAPPTIDPLRMPSRRAIVPLTAGTVSYVEAGREIEVKVETVLLNSTWIESFESALTEDVDRDELAPDGSDGSDGATNPDPQTEPSGA